MPDLNEPTFDARRKAMAMVIAAHASLCAEETGRDALSDRVMAAMARAPRHLFVPAALQSLAYEDTPLPIGCEKTISQPFMVALIADLLEVGETHKVLEVGAGLGYQAAVLAELCERVYAVEIVSELAGEAERRLMEAGYGGVRLRIGDGSRGWPDAAPFDRIVVSAAAKRVPAALLDQLAPGGRLVMPAGEDDAQVLRLIEKGADGEITERALIPVRFSALTISH